MLASMSILLVIGLVFAGLATLFHIYVFYLESIAWTKPATWKVFGLKSQADADTIKPMALNQGFYNLFLTIGIVVGIAIIGVSFPAGIALVFMGTGSMVLAATVLIVSNPRSARSAVLQGVPPLVAIVLLALSFAV